MSSEFITFAALWGQVVLCDERDHGASQCFSLVQA